MPRNYSSSSASSTSTLSSSARSASARLCACCRHDVDGNLHVSPQCRIVETVGECPHRRQIERPGGGLAPATGALVRPRLTVETHGDAHPAAARLARGRLCGRGGRCGRLVPPTRVLRLAESPRAAAARVRVPPPIGREAACPRSWPVCTAGRVGHALAGRAASRAEAVLAAARPRTGMESSAGENGTTSSPQLHRNEFADGGLAEADDRHRRAGWPERGIDQEHDPRLLAAVQFFAQCGDIGLGQGDRLREAGRTSSCACASAACLHRRKPASHFGIVGGIDSFTQRMIGRHGRADGHRLSRRRRPVPRAGRAAEPNGSRSPWTTKTGTPAANSSGSRVGALLPGPTRRLKRKRQREHADGTDRQSGAAGDPRAAAASAHDERHLIR